MQRLSLVMVLLLQAPLAFAQIYTWTDAGGTVHFSEAPPAPGVHYKQVTVNGGVMPVADMPHAPADAKTVDDGDPASTPAAPAQPMTDTPANRAKLCATLTTNLATLRGSRPVVMKQGDKDVALADSQRKAQLDSAEAQYQQYCRNSR